MEARKKISLAVLGALCCVQFGGIAMAEEEKPTADLSVSALSQYIWRGFELSKDSIVIQPSMTVGYKGFSANLWGNVDTNVVGDMGSDWNETDFTLAYDRSMGMVDLTAGYIYYGLIGEDSQEIFVSAALNVLLTPTLSVYKDFDYFPGWYATLGVSHSVPITEKMNLDLGAQIGYMDVEDYSELHDGLLTASISIPVTDYISITPALNYSFPLTSDSGDAIEASSFSGDDSFIFGGVTVSMAF